MLDGKAKGPRKSDFARNTARYRHMDYGTAPTIIYIPTVPSRTQYQYYSKQRRYFLWIFFLTRKALVQK